MVPTAPLLAALGEAISLTPKGGVATPLRGIVGRSAAYSPEGDEQYYADWVDLPAAPAFGLGDAVQYRNRTAVITAIGQGSDPGRVRYMLGR